MLLAVEAPGRLAFIEQEVRAPGEGEVLLQTLVSGVSHGTEMRRWKTDALEPAWDNRLRLAHGVSRRTYPLALGYDNIARVVAVGNHVTLPVGSIVWTNQPHQEWSLVNEHHARSGLLFSPEMASSLSPGDLEPFTFTIRAGVALNAIHDAGIVLGSRVAVIGMGAIGLLVAQMALLNGASEVYGVDLYPRRLSLAQNLGMIPMVCGEQDEDAAYTLKRRCGGVDVAIETSGTYAGLQTALRSCCMGGTVVTVSTYRGQASELCLAEEWSKNRLTIHSSMWINGCPSRYAPLWDKRRLDEASRALLASGRLHTHALVTHRFPFHQALEAFRLIETSPGEVLQVVFLYEEGEMPRVPVSQTVTTHC